MMKGVRIMTVALEPLYTQQVACPLCETKYSTMKVRSRFAYAYQTDSDFCPHYKSDNNPLYYFVYVCPECGYAYTKQFSDDFNPMVKEKLKEQISDKWEKRDFGYKRNIEQALSTIKLAIFSGTIKQEKHSVIAGLCLRLAWLYRREESKEQEERFLRLAVKEYENAYTQCDFDDTSMSEIKVIYLIGELNRRLGEFHKAIRYFSMVTEHKNKNLETGIVRLAREQWQVAREEYKKVQEEE